MATDVLPLSLSPPPPPPRPPPPPPPPPLLWPVAVSRGASVREEHLPAYHACRKEHAYNAYREEHLSAYKMDVRDYFGSQKTLVFSGKREIIPTGWVQLKDKKDELRRCCHSYSATWPPAPSTLPVEPPLIGLQMSSMVSTRTRLR